MSFVLVSFQYIPITGLAVGDKNASLGLGDKTACLGLGSKK